MSLFSVILNIGVYIFQNKLRLSSTINENNLENSKNAYKVTSKSITRSEAYYYSNKIPKHQFATTRFPIFEFNLENKGNKKITIESLNLEIKTTSLIIEPIFDIDLDDDVDIWIDKERDLNWRDLKLKIRNIKELKRRILIEPENSILSSYFEIKPTEIVLEAGEEKVVCILSKANRKSRDKLSKDIIFRGTDNTWDLPDITYNIEQGEGLKLKVKVFSKDSSTSKTMDYILYSKEFYGDILSKNLLQFNPRYGFYRTILVGFGAVGVVNHNLGRLEIEPSITNQIISKPINFIVEELNDNMNIAVELVSSVPLKIVCDIFLKLKNGGRYYICRDYRISIDY